MNRRARARARRHNIARSAHPLRLFPPEGSEEREGGSKGETHGEEAGRVIARRERRRWRIRFAGTPADNDVGRVRR
jgi:hypothetical protein